MRRAISVSLMILSLAAVTGRAVDEKPATLPAVAKATRAADAGDQHKRALSLPGKKALAPVVFTSGGGWHTGSRKSVTPVGAKLQGLGFGCALVSHRLSPKDKFPAHVED